MKVTTAIQGAASGKFRQLPRLALLAGLFVAELMALSFWLDGASLSRGNPLTAWMQRWGAIALRSVVAFAGLFLLLAYLRARELLARIAADAQKIPIDWKLLAGHFAAMGICAVLSPVLYSGGKLYGVGTDFAAIAWLVCGLGAIVLAGLALVHASLWRQALRATGWIWLAALLVGFGSSWLGTSLRLLWQPAARLTFGIVSLLVHPLVPNFRADLSTMVMGSPAFEVHIAPECSGLEGMGLVLVFAVAWLWLFRRDLRFPNALLVVPLGLVAAFLLNSVRIAALIAIGSAGATSVAAGGFHSQAGWIAFNVVALCLTLGAQRIPGVTLRREPERDPSASTGNATAAYLTPFLAILAAAMISKAASGQFEWLYPLRFFAAMGVLWWHRRQFRQLDWRFGWMAIVTGALVFGLWLGLDRIAASNIADGTAPSLATGHGAAWVIWLGLRTLGAVVTVPIAEELAFRGFLMRRIVDADFEKVDFRGVTAIAIVVSSVAFGMMHGGRWLAGALAGVLYALAVRRGGRIGDAVAAHACTNALLAVWVISRGEWRLW